MKLKFQKKIIICYHGKVFDFGKPCFFVYNNHLRTSSFNHMVSLDVKVPQYLVSFTFFYCLWVCSYHFGFTSIPILRHTSQWIRFPTQSCRRFYSFWAILLQSLMIWFIVSSTCPNISHLFSSCVNLCFNDIGAYCLFLCCHYHWFRSSFNSCIFKPTPSTIARFIACLSVCLKNCPCRVFSFQAYLSSFFRNAYSASLSPSNSFAALATVRNLSLLFLTYLWKPMTARFITSFTISNPLLTSFLVIYNLSTLLFGAIPDALSIASHHIAKNSQKRFIIRVRQSEQFSSSTSWNFSTEI